ncbi:chitin synthase-domain-containing protein [Entophlyctis helioformis]|nr:chitin synthase-domain-containing protein [Entophlyctis helioformis]
MRLTVLLLASPLWLPVCANPLDDFFDSLSTLTTGAYRNTPAFSSTIRHRTWRKNTAVAVVQGFLVFASLADFAVFTLMFLYGTFLSMRVMPNWKRVSLVALTIVFLGFRFLYLPFITMLIPLQGLWYFPKPAFVVSFFGLAMFYIILLIVPLSFGIYWAIKYRLWRNARRMTHKVLKRAMIRVRKRIKKDRIPQMIVVMPIYNEDPEALKTAVHSVVQSIYPQARMTVFLSFDDDKESDLYLDLMQFLTKSDKHEPGKFPESCIVKYMGVRFVVNRFPHGGKRNTQALTFEQIQTMFSAVEDSAYVLFIDSDIILYPDCMIEFVRAMEKDATTSSSRERNMLCYFQDCEYMAGQVFWRSLEAALGGVTCLPGALTILRLKELSVAAKTYFSELKTESIFDFHRFHLGEDRYLTHLLMEQSKSYSIGFCPSARAKTETPGTMASLVKQRRRWLLGALSNVICFFCDFKLWLRFPLLMIFNFCDLASRSTAFFVHILLLQMLSGVQFSWLQIAIMLAPFVMRWMLLISFSFILKRFKASLVFPLMILVDPWANFFINVYAIWTWNTRSWGGPRATAQDEAGSKQENTVESVAHTGRYALGFSRNVGQVSALATITDGLRFNVSSSSIDSTTWDSDTTDNSDPESDISSNDLPMKARSASPMAPGRFQTGALPRHYLMPSTSLYIVTVAPNNPSAAGRAADRMDGGSDCDASSHGSTTPPLRIAATALQASPTTTATVL